jgi:hypothetical protein
VRTEEPEKPEDEVDTCFERIAMLLCLLRKMRCTALQNRVRTPKKTALDGAR